MLGVGELLVSLAWGLLPMSKRLSVAAKIANLQARAAQSTPRSRVKIYNSPFESVEPIPYSILTTCFNERENCEQWLSSVLSQNPRPAQVVVVDGGSTDGTVSELERLKNKLESSGKLNLELKIIFGEKLNISAGRNRAAAEATAQILLFSDFGTTLDRHWAARLLYPFAKEPQTEVVMGWYRPIATGGFQSALAHFLLPQAESLNPETFLPSGRSLAIRKDIFRKTPGYPEFLSRSGEDSLFDYYLKGTANEFAFVPEAVAYWKVPSSLGKLFATVVSYARGDAEGGELFGSYYLELTPKILKLALEVLLLLILLLIGAADFFLGKCLILATLTSALLRLWFLVAGYRPWVGAKSFAECFYRMSAAGFMAIAQGIGFLRGLSGREEAERRRILSAAKGEVLVIADEVLTNDSSGQQREFVGDLLNAGWYVTLVCAKGATLNTEYSFLLPHPRLEQHLRRSFDVQSWWTKHSKICSDSQRKFYFLDRCGDALSKELIAKLVPLGVSEFHQ